MANDVNSVPIKDIVTPKKLKGVMSSKSIWSVYEDIMNRNVIVPMAEYIEQWNKKSPF